MKLPWHIVNKIEEKEENVMKLSSHIVNKIKEKGGNAHGLGTCLNH